MKAIVLINDGKGHALRILIYDRLYGYTRVTVLFHPDKMGIEINM